MIRTTDGGHTWQQFRLSGADEVVFGRPRDMYVRVSFSTPARGWLAANSGTWQTDDGGLSWRRIFAEPYDGIQFADGQHGWMFVTHESGGQNYSTRDGGATWRQLTADEVVSGVNLRDEAGRIPA